LTPLEKGAPCLLFSDPQEMTLGEFPKFSLDFGILLLYIKSSITDISSYTYICEVVMTGGMVSTMEVAALLQVTETTIKRWADESVLRCVRTPGGHRKFLLSEVVHLAERQGYTVSGSQPPPMPQRRMEQLQTGVFTQNYAKIAAVFRDVALKCDREGLSTLLLYLYKQHIPLPVVLDEVIRPCFDEIGREWEKGDIGVDREHAASHAVAESLARAVPELHRKEPNGKTALCACPEGELHELGLRGLAYSLECEGWNVHYLGGNTPLGSISSAVRAARPDLVCLSLTSVRLRNELVQKLRNLASSVHSYNGKVLIGGEGAQKLQDQDVKGDHIAPSIQDAITYARDVFQLKPGPKKSSGKEIKATTRTPSTRKFGVDPHRGHIQSPR
jgi:MerR family transcriptional regulator, light-induced transcriptional regulator